MTLPPKRPLDTASWMVNGSITADLPAGGEVENRPVTPMYTLRLAFILALAGCAAVFAAGKPMPKAPPPPAFAQWSPTPPMGWNSYDAYHGAITEAQFRRVVDYMAAKMKPLGYDYVVIDYLWFHPGPPGWDPRPGHWRTFPLQQTRGSNGRLEPRMVFDGYGRPLPAPNRFPSAINGAGFRPLADYVHSKGLKFGIHIMRGIAAQVVQDNLPILGTPYHARDIYDPTDQSSFLKGMWYGVDHTKPGAQAYYNSLFNLFASWGVDFVKCDDITGAHYHRAEIELVRHAIDQCGRPIVLSLSYGETPISMAWHVRANANMWRVSADFWDDWPALLHMFDLRNAWSPFIGQGSWPDADMIPIGHLCLTGFPDGKKPEHDSYFTTEEQYALMSLWCISRSPLMWGGDPFTSSARSKAMLTNPEVLVVDQHSCNNRQIYSRPQNQTANLRIWFADIPGSDDKYLGLFNLTDRSSEVPFDFADGELHGSYRVRDLWQRRDLGVFTGSFTARIAPHGGRLYRLTPVH